MALISASDSLALSDLSETPERLVEDLKINEAITRAANDGYHTVSINYRDNHKMQAFTNRLSLVEYLSANGYIVTTCGVKSVTISWSPHETGEPDGYGNW